MHRGLIALTADSHRAAPDPAPRPAHRPAARRRQRSWTGALLHLLGSGTRDEAAGEGWPGGASRNSRRVDAWHRGITSVSSAEVTPGEQALCVSLKQRCAAGQRGGANRGCTRGVSIPYTHPLHASPFTAPTPCKRTHLRWRSRGTITRYRFPHPLKIRTLLQQPVFQPSPLVRALLLVCR